jgi:hypothetical protein
MWYFADLVCLPIEAIKHACQHRFIGLYQAKAKTTSLANVRAATKSRLLPQAKAIIFEDHHRTCCSAPIKPHASRGTVITLVLGDWIPLDPARLRQSRGNAIGRVQRSISE